MENTIPKQFGQNETRLRESNSVKVSLSAQLSQNAGLLQDLVRGGPLDFHSRFAYAVSPAQVEWVNRFLHMLPTWLTRFTRQPPFGFEFMSTFKELLGMGVEPLCNSDGRLQRVVCAFLVARVYLLHSVGCVAHQ